MEQVIDDLENLGLRNLALKVIEQGEEIEKLQNIIKEAREKIDNLGTYELLGTKYISKREVMKILDKENK